MIDSIISVSCFLGVRRGDNCELCFADRYASGLGSAFALIVGRRQLDLPDTDVRGSSASLTDTITRLGRFDSVSSAIYKREQKNIYVDEVAHAACIC